MTITPHDSPPTPLPPPDPFIQTCLAAVVVALAVQPFAPMPHVQVQDLEDLRDELELADSLGGSLVVTAAQTRLMGACVYVTRALVQEGVTPPLTPDLQEAIGEARLTEAFERIDATVHPGKHRA